VLCFQREHDGRSFVVFLNFSTEERLLPPAQFNAPRLVLSTDPDRKRGICEASITLSGNEGLVLAVS